jgi:tetratricopeptide (TPR) repeat protein
MSTKNGQDMDYSAQLNNLGVICLNAGCDQHFVMRLFNDSLHENLLNIKGQPSTANAEEQKRRIDQSIIELRRAEQWSRNPLQPGKIANGGCFVYTKAILLQSEQTEMEKGDLDVPDDEISMFSAVRSATILYNLGLMNHLIAFSSAEVNQVFTDKARKLYEMAFSLLSHAYANSGGSFVVIAVLNNLGQINREIGRFDQSNEYFEKLCTFLLGMSTIPEYDANGMNAIVSESDWAGLVFNAMVLQNKVGAPAA